MIWNGSDRLNDTKSGQETVEDIDITVTLKTAQTKKPFKIIIKIQPYFSNPTLIFLSVREAYAMLFFCKKEKNKKKESKN